MSASRANWTPSQHDPTECSASARAVRRHYDTPGKVRRELLPMPGGMILCSWCSLWILHVDMNMRSSLM